MAGIPTPKYLAFADIRFLENAQRDVARVFGSAKFKMYEGIGGVLLFFIDGGSCDASAFGDCGFIDFVARVEAVVDCTVCDYGKIAGSVADILKAKGARSFKLEAKKIDSNVEDRAKVIEIGVGRKVEEAGLPASLEDPGEVLHLVFVKNTAYICTKICGTGKAIDSFRTEARSGARGINRSEFKLREAVEFFGIDISKVGSCIDVGAAPGGWTHYLSERGVVVIAVDVAPLLYEMFPGKRLAVLEDWVELSKYSNGYDIIHVKAQLRVGSAPGGLQARSAGMATIDANIEPEQSARLANSLAGLLRSGAPLVITLKLANGAPARYLSGIEQILSEKYGSIRIKKLPHNRKEVTLFARAL
jgi:hypothetical protein